MWEDLCTGHEAVPAIARSRSAVSVAVLALTDNLIEVSHVAKEASVMVVVHAPVVAVEQEDAEVLCEREGYCGRSRRREPSHCFREAEKRRSRLQGSGLAKWPPEDCRR